MKVKIENGEMVITIPVETVNPPLSGSGKTRLVASERDKGSLEVQGKSVTVQVNAYIKA